MEYLYSREYILMRASKPDWMEGKKLRKIFEFMVYIYI